MILTIYLHVIVIFIVVGVIGALMQSASLTQEDKEKFFTPQAKFLRWIMFTTLLLLCLDKLNYI